MRDHKREELRRRIDEVLFYIWDPIGVGPDPKARAEYRSYASKIVQMLSDDRDVFTISKYLREIESGMLSLPANEERANIVAKLILAHKEAVEEGRA